MGHTRGTFTPGAGSIQVVLGKWRDDLSPLPSSVPQADLQERFPVEQNTCVEGCNGVYFDEPLWTALVGFVTADGGDVAVIRQCETVSETSLSDFLETWTTTSPEEREPPWAILARKDGSIKLAMVTAYGVNIGGDKFWLCSYTYSLFSDHDVGAEVISLLRHHAASSRWDFLSPAKDFPPEKSRLPPAEHGLLTRVLMRALGRGRE